MFKKVEERQKHRTEENDPDVELLFRKGAISNKARQEIQDLNVLVSSFSRKYDLNDVWGRSYKSNSQELSILFSKSTLNGMETKHPIVALFEAYGIQQQIEQGWVHHLQYSVFTFNHNQCKDLKIAIDLLNPSADELEKLSEHASKEQVLC